ncbi:MAG: DUF116 domain-containing protein [Chloroflexi bacterium]|nr:DUF116 domain-containing protein [Chloroflexota bacterium]
MIYNFAYDLRINQQDSLPAHQQISVFTDRWLGYLRTAHAGLLEEYRQFRQSSGFPALSFAESALELTAFCVYLQEHSAEARAFSGLGAAALTALVELQDRLPWFERPIKDLRSRVQYLSTRKPASPGAAPDLDPASLSRLLRWLRAQGQSVLAEHFQPWARCFGRRGRQQCQAALNDCLLIAAQFTAFSGEVLGGYTRGAEAFRQSARRDACLRYDAALRGRARAEYHLGLFGTEILNREFRPAFLQSSEKLVIVPRCLRAHPQGMCKAVPARLGTRCTGCTPHCQVNQISQICRPLGIHVADIPDDQLKFLCRASGHAGSGLGVLGLSCAPTNWLAGWEAQKLGLAAQGLLLDYPACREHWHAQGLPTSTSLLRLKEILNISPEIEQVESPAWVLLPAKPAEVVA